MITTRIVIEIDGTPYEFSTELPGTADWARTQEETAIGLLFEGTEQIARVLGVPRPEPQEVPAEEIDTRRCGSRHWEAPDTCSRQCGKTAGHVERGDTKHQTPSGKLIWFEDVPLEDPEQERAAQLIAKVQSGEIKTHTDDCGCPMGKVGCAR